MGRRVILVALIVVLAAAAGCGAPGGAPSPPPAADTSPPSPTATPGLVATATPSVERVVFDDPEGDCILSEAQTPTACDPPEFDILRVTVERGSPVVIELAFQRDGITSGAGLGSLDTYTVLHGIDVDRDPTTGATAGWPELHGVAPDLVLQYQVQAGQAQSGITQYAPDGTRTAVDPALAVWEVVDPYTIRATISDELFDVAEFGLAGDVFGAVLYDHYVDGGHLVFPSGETPMVP